jgi:antitoxin HigA-1
MALRLAKCLDRTPESWLAMQHIYDLWRARKTLDLHKVESIKLTAT